MNELKELLRGYPKKELIEDFIGVFVIGPVLVAIIWALLVMAQTPSH